MKRIFLFMAVVAISFPSFGRVICDTACHAPEGFFVKQEKSLKMIANEVTPASGIRPLLCKRWYAAAAVM